MWFLQNKKLCSLLAEHYAMTTTSVIGSYALLILMMLDGIFAH
jgi:hypothetical protein